MKKHRDVWDRDIEQILLSEGELDEIVTRMAAQIDADYRDKNLLVHTEREPCFHGRFDEEAHHPL